MAKLHLKVITPKKIVLDEEVNAITVTTVEGEITVLPKHEPLLSLLTEGIMHIKKEGDEEYLAIGGGYLETDGSVLQILVSRAYGQNEIDQQLTQKAMEDAKKIIAETKNKSELVEANAVLRRSMLDLKLLKLRKRTH